jgi:asparagine synthase (glutamine-hydrolysing)
MCGIIAISFRAGRPIILYEALEAIKHRGPDGKGIFASERRDCHLGHVRLSILDLSTAGHQPMADASGRFVISYNGEVYNYRSLQADLVQRHGPIAWRSGTDTELIVEGFAKEGIDFLNRMNGIFALAIYDTEKRLLHVLRDPLGIKPLFITEQQGGWFFCSELKGLLAIPGLTWTLRQGSFADQLAFMYVPEPHTVYNEARKVEPGICFTYRDGKRVDARSLFSHLYDPIDLSSEGEAIECLRSVFATAVERQLMADVPVSLFLSGGLDSSAVAQQAVRGGAKIKDAYTIAFSHDDRKLDAQSDDLHYATFIAKELGLELRVIEATDDFIALLPTLIRFMEDGFTDPAAINTYLISAAARDAGVKVMLSGQGADEYLGGYRLPPAEKFLRRIPAPLRSAAALLGRFVSRGLSGRANAVSRRIARLANLANQSPSDRLLSMYSWTAPGTIQELLLASEPWIDGAAFRASFDSYADDDIVDAMMKVDQRYDLMSLNLCYTDRMTMAAGVEARVPFLDFDLVRVMNAIPLGLKIRKREGKYVLKKAMEPFLPNKIIYREKAGFGLPIRAWLHKENELVNTYLCENRIKRQGLFRPEAVRRVMDEQFNGVTDHANTLFTLLCQQIWLEEYSSHT